ncbi:hypothetical protein HG530_012056 [Fusarium avenaceum]|nr:hypothetical protein HG530_012056 [Fusarium avenaceum]
MIMTMAMKLSCFPLLTKLNKRRALLCLGINPVENRNALYVTCLGEEIKTPKALNLVPLSFSFAAHQDANISSLRMHEIGIATLAGRVKNNDGLVAVVCNALEELTSIGGDELAAILAHAIQGGIAACIGDRVSGNVNADRVLEERGESDSEETGARVSVDEVLDIHARTSGVVVLKERACWVGESVRTDVFGCGGLGVGDAGLDVDRVFVIDTNSVRKCLAAGLFAIFGHTLSVFAEQNRSTALVVRELLLHALALTGHTKTHSIGSNRAILNVKNLPATLLHESNIRALLKGDSGVLSSLARAESRRSVEVRRQLGAVAVLQGATHSVLNSGDDVGVEVGEVLESLFDNALLELELLRVLKHLELAAAAGGEVLAADSGVVA